jgi:hypothetical protein
MVVVVVVRRRRQIAESVVRIAYSYACELCYCLCLSESVPEAAISQYDLN